MLRIFVNLVRDGLRRVDHLRPAAAWSAGIALGLLAGLALAGAAPLAVGGAGFLLLLGLAGWLVRSGEPVGVPLAEAPPARPPLVDLVEIPAGRFRMGSPRGEEGRWDDEGPVREVTLSAFACMKFPVTRELYAEIAGSDPGWPEGEAGDRPANNVSWYDAVAFCNLLSEKEGLAPCYRIEGQEVTWDRAAGGYRLPTEAEWEYACRAGTTSRWSFGDEEANLSEYAWFGGNAEDEPRPVGTKKPNAWGLHDLHGNVYEWCWDRFGPYAAEPQDDPDGPAEGAGRVLRGGSFLNAPRNLRSADRDGFQPEDRNQDVGFRCVRAPRRQP